MTQSHHPSDKPSPAAPKGQAGAQESGRMLPPESEPFTRDELLAPFSREELLARYRRQRALPDDPFEQGGKPVPPPGYRDRIMSHPRPVSRFLEPEDAPAAPAPQRRSLSLGQTFAVAAAMALAAGAGVGMINARLLSGAPVAPSADPAPVQASTLATVAPEAQVSKRTVVTKKAVSTATLEVSDAAGETNSFIPLALSAQPAELGSDILLKISGIPEGAYLTSGRRDEDKMWALTLAELKDLRLVVPEAQDPKLDLAVAAFEPQTGELAAPVKTMTVALSDVVVQPASAPPPGQTTSLTTGKTAQPAAIPAPDSMTMAALEPAEASAARSLVLEGDELLKSGDVRQARSSYEKAWAGGSPAGAYGMARSFDPVVLGGLALKNDKPDTAKALEWYERAALAGHAGAADSIVRLRLKR
jgi:hypothetical protein